MSSITEVKPITTKSVDGDDIPWVPFAPYSDEVFLKYHHINPVQGEILVSMRFPAGMRLPTHYHTGIVIAPHDQGRVALPRARLGLARGRHRVRDRRIRAHPRELRR